MKNYIIIKKILLLIVLFSNLFSNIAYAEIPVWNYTENLITGGASPKIHGPFLSEQECKIDRAKFLKTPSGLISKTTECTASTIAGNPAPKANAQSNPTPNIVAAAEDCIIESAYWKPAGEQEDGFYKDKSTIANIIVETKNCVGQPGLLLSIEEDDGVITNMTNDYWNDSNLYKRSITVPTDNFTIKILLGEEDCDSLAGGGVNYDCDLYFQLSQRDGQEYNSRNKSSGMLFYECDLVCDENAKLLEIIPNGNDSAPVNINAQQPVNLDSDTYKFLAPIGKETEVKTTNIGNYINTIIKTIIGLSAALAVVMIILAGIQWMGNESVFGKTEAKSKISAAILGLIIALGSYALLNTINPDLLGKNGLSISNVNIELESEPVPWSTYSSGGSLTLCPEGFEDVGTFDLNNSKINVCKSISSDIKNLISKAKVDGLILSGYGSRSIEQQRELRRKNQCPDIENSVAESCKPPTARPGRSMHESGKAIDFRCNGKGMVESGGRNSPCYKWLASNVAIHKLKNLNSESWHWSTTGR